jgi:hypothetical protein
LITSAVALLSGSTLTLAPGSPFTVISSFSLRMESWMGSCTVPPALTVTSLLNGEKPGKVTLTV